MTDIDFDELDKAVHGAMTARQSSSSQPQLTPESTTDIAASDSAVTPLAARRKGKFMDIVRDVSPGESLPLSTKTPKQAPPAPRSYIQPEFTRSRPAIVPTEPPVLSPASSDDEPLFQKHDSGSSTDSHTARSLSPWHGETSHAMMPDSIDFSPHGFSDEVPETDNNDIATASHEHRSQSGKPSDDVGQSLKDVPGDETDDLEEELESLIDNIQHRSDLRESEAPLTTPFLPDASDKVKEAKRPLGRTPLEDEAFDHDEMTADIELAAMAKESGDLSHQDTTDDTPLTPIQDTRQDQHPVAPVDPLHHSIDAPYAERVWSSEPATHPGDHPTATVVVDHSPVAESRKLMDMDDSLPARRQDVLPFSGEITPQYEAKPSSSTSDLESSVAVFDTDTYHKPIQPQPRSRSHASHIWIWVFCTLASILAGPIGGALYFLMTNH